MLHIVPCITAFPRMRAGPDPTDGKAAAGLAGHAPIIRAPGKWTGRSRIGGGRRRFRRAFYMSALVAARHNRRLGKTYPALGSAGKPAHVAITVVMKRSWSALTP
jgi:transposase